MQQTRSHNNLSVASAALHQESLRGGGAIRGLSCAPPPSPSDPALSEVNAPVLPSTSDASHGVSAPRKHALQMAS